MVTNHLIIMQGTILRQVFENSYHRKGIKF